MGVKSRRWSNACVILWLFPKIVVVEQHTSVPAPFVRPVYACLFCVQLISCVRASVTLRSRMQSRTTTTSRSQIIPSSLLPLPLLCSRPGLGSLIYVSFVVSQSPGFRRVFVKPRARTSIFSEPGATRTGIKLPLISLVHGVRERVDAPGDDEAGGEEWHHGLGYISFASVSNMILSE